MNLQYYLNLNGQARHTPVTTQRIKYFENTLLSHSIKDLSELIVFFIEQRLNYFISTKNIYKNEL